MNKNVAYKEAFKFGWTSFKTHWQFMLVAMVLLSLVSSLSDFLVNNHFKEIEPTASILSLLFSLVLMFFYFNIVRAMLRMVDGGRPVLEDLFLYDRSFWLYFFGLCLYTIVTVVGTVLFILPGIYFSLRYGQYLYIIADRQLGPIDAFRESARLTNGVKWQLLGLGFLSYLLIVVGLLVVVIGVVVAIPVAALASAYVYRTLSQQTNEPVPVTVAPTLATIPPSVGTTLEKTSDFAGTSGKDK